MPILNYPIIKKATVTVAFFMMNIYIEREYPKRVWSSSLLMILEDVVANID